MSEKLVHGKGRYSKGKYSATVNGRMTKPYDRWKDMLKRCYSPKLQEANPTYVGCAVTDEWLDFQVFAEWFEGQEYSGADYQLDKDLLVQGNKIYSPTTCCFVPRELNTLLSDCSRARGKHPQGVHFSKTNGRYQALIRLDGKRKHLGYYDCPNEAYMVYRKAKEANVKRMALEWQGRIADNVFQALMDWQLT